MLRRIIIIGGYILGAVIVIGGTVVLVAYGNGYSYDLKAGRLVHRGLLLLESKPSNSAVSLNGRDLNDTTPYRKSLEGGTYTYSLAKDGYRTWTKEVEIIPSRVTATQYVLLMPQRFEVSDISTYPAIQQFVSSGDRSRIAYIVPGGQEAGLWMLNARNQKTERIYTIPLDPAGQPLEKLEVLSWADDASKVLVKKTSAAGETGLVLAANGSGSPIDLNDMFKTNVLASRFSKADSSQLLWSSPEGLRRIDINDRSVSEPLARGVLAYADAGDRIFYVSNATPKPSLWQVNRGGQKRQLVESLPPSASYDVAYSSYINVPQVAVAVPDQQKTLLYPNVDADSLTPIAVQTPSGNLSFNGDGRFLLITSAAGVANYDQELSKLYNLSTGSSPIGGISWFDNYHLQYVQDGKAVLSEYDGNYATGITRVNGLPPFNSPDDKSLFVVAQTSSGSMQIRSIQIRQ